jgi:hypothetical protein
VICSPNASRRCASDSPQGGAFTTFAGRNALQENGLLGGLWYRF